MPFKVLIVDDSNFFQQRLKEIINENPELKVVGVASNGQEAIEMDDELKPDIISMDYEMPFLDGVSAVRVILSKRKVPIVMFSSMTYEGARITLEALEAGAVDFIPKNFAEVSRDSAVLKQRLHDKLIEFARSAQPATKKPESASALSSTPSSSPPERSKTRSSLAKSTPEPSAPPRPSFSRKASIKGKVKIVVIGASTGGPVALTEIITKIPATFPVPIVIVQHMPENFTKAFAERLNRQSKLNVKEAENGERIERGNVYVGPGGMQIMFERTGSKVKIIPGDDRVNYKPCVDITFASAASVFGSGTLGIVLTGMGSDGCEGARLLKQKGATIWGQDKETCVVYGMPAAVAQADLVDDVLPVGGFPQKLVNDV